jgi:MFS family permease
MFFVQVSVFVMINNSCNSYNRGKVHGMAMSAASIAKCLAPFIISNMFAWSTNTNTFWINYQFVFVFLGILCFISSLTYFKISSNVESVPELSQPLLDKHSDSLEDHLKDK